MLLFQQNRHPPLGKQMNGSGGSLAPFLLPFAPLMLSVSFKEPRYPAKGASSCFRYPAKGTPSLLRLLLMLRRLLFLLLSLFLLRHRLLLHLCLRLRPRLLLLLLLLLLLWRLLFQTFPDDAANKNQTDITDKRIEYAYQFSEWELT